MRDVLRENERTFESPVLAVSTPPPSPSMIIISTTIGIMCSELIFEFRSTASRDKVWLDQHRQVIRDAASTGKINSLVRNIDELKTQLDSVSKTRMIRTKSLSDLSTLGTEISSTSVSSTFSSSSESYVSADPSESHVSTDPSESHVSADPSESRVSTDPSKSLGSPVLTDPLESQSSTDPSESHVPTDPSASVVSTDSSKSLSMDPRSEENDLCSRSPSSSAFSTPNTSDRSAVNVSSVRLDVNRHLIQKLSSRSLPVSPRFSPSPPPYEFSKIKNRHDKPSKKSRSAGSDSDKSVSSKSFNRIVWLSVCGHSFI